MLQYSLAMYTIRSYKRDHTTITKQTTYVTFKKSNTIMMFTKTNRHGEENNTSISDKRFFEIINVIHVNYERLHVFPSTNENTSIEALCTHTMLNS